MPDGGSKRVEQKIDALFLAQYDAAMSPRDSLLFFLSFVCGVPLLTPLPANDPSPSPRPDSESERPGKGEERGEGTFG